MSVSRVVVLTSVLSSLAFAQTNVEVTGKKGTVGVKTGAGGVEIKGKDGKKVKVGTTGTAVEVESGDKNVDIGTAGTGVQVQSGAKKVEVGGRGSSVNVQSGDKTGAVRAEAGPEPTVKDGTFQLNGVGRKLTHACQPNEDVELNGQGYELTLTGPCRKVMVNGQGHAVSIETVDTLMVSGMGNNAVWKSALTGTKPKVSVSGLNNTATQAK